MFSFFFGARGFKPKLGAGSQDRNFHSAHLWSGPLWPNFCSWEFVRHRAVFVRRQDQFSCNNVADLCS